MKRALLSFVSVMLASHVALAATPDLPQGGLGAGASAQPVEISADKSLEWNRAAKTYTARQHAIAKQGTAQVAADTLTAHYNDDQGGTDIYQINADGHVVLQSPPYTAYGDKAVYDVHNKAAVLTGQDLHIETPTDRLTAKEKITYDGMANRMDALGGATAVRNGDTLVADKMSAFFGAGDDGKTALQKITADGHVSIKTMKGETVYGDHGIYDIPTQKAHLTGAVKMRQLDNWLEGTKAEVDMKTGISQLYGAGNAVTEGRVKGIFYPKGKPAADAAVAAKAAAEAAAATSKVKSTPAPLPPTTPDTPATPPAGATPAPTAAPALISPSTTAPAASGDNKP